MSKYLFRVGEKARVVSRPGDHWDFYGAMKRFMGTVVTISAVGDYKIEEDGGMWFWVEEDFEKIN